MTPFHRELVPDHDLSVLLAEDDVEMRALVARGLRRFGFTVIEAVDGAHLATLLESLVIRPIGSTRAIDAIVTDVRMPGASGLEVMAQLRTRDWATPVILMTAFGDPALHAEARRLGADAVFDKPFDIEDLCTAVVAVVRP